MSEIDRFPLSAEILLEIVMFLIPANIGRYAVPYLSFLKKRRTSVAENYRTVVRFARTNSFIYETIFNHGLKVMYLHNKTKPLEPRIQFLQKNYNLHISYFIQ